VAIETVPCRNQVTGAEADIPETALRHLPNWQPIDQLAPPDPALAGDEPSPETPAADGAAPTTQAQGRRRGQD
jgi:hypothetical protein